MKIVTTPARYYPYIGGVEKYVQDIARMLVAHGHHVDVVCADEPHTGSGEDRGVRVTRLPYIFKVANTNITLSLPWRLLRMNFDVMHTNLPTPWAADWSTLIAKLKGKPVVLTYQNDIVGQGMGGLLAWIYNHTLLRLTLRFADIILVSHKRYPIYSPLLRRYRHKVRAVPLGVDTNAFKKVTVEKNEHELFFLSALTLYHRYKGLDVLLDALVRVKERVSSVLLTVGGDGDLLAHYQEQVAKRGLGKNVVFAGKIPQDELTTYYSRAAVFVLPSLSARQEGFGLVNLEALACGTPVVTTDVVGVAEDVLKYACGLVVQPNNAKALAAGIVELLVNQEKRRVLERNSAALVAEYTLTRYVELLEEVYDNIQRK